MLDLLAPTASSPPLTISLAAGDVAGAWDGWRLAWEITNDPVSAGLHLEHILAGDVVAVSPLIEQPFNTWTTIEFMIRPVTGEQRIVTLIAHTADGLRVSSLEIENEALVPFVNTVVIGATVDSAPWLDNLLICHRQALPGGTTVAETPGAIVTAAPGS
jgi:hypothetical protein